ncbi:ribonucleotide reductase N-terminal alpha domain-containing protein, partial [Trichlorobacter lovleyi]
MPAQASAAGQPALTPNALTVLEKRYLKRDTSGKPLETPADMFRRVAETIAEPDKKFDKKADVKKLADRFYEMIVSFDFLPNSPTLMNAGRELGQLSACFVLPVGDSIEEIFDAVKFTA